MVYTNTKLFIIKIYYFKIITKKIECRRRHREIFTKKKNIMKVKLCSHFILFVLFSLILNIYISHPLFLYIYIL